MKKIMNTTLVAVALTIAFVGNVDAKRLRRDPISVKESATNVVEATKNAVDNPTPENKDELVNTLNEEANTPERKRTLELKAEEARLNDAIKLVEMRQKETGASWYNIFASEDSKKANRAASDRLKDLNSELKTVKDELKMNAKEVGSAWMTVAGYAVKAVIVLGIPALAIADIYYGTGYMKAGKEAAMKHGKALYGRAKGAAGRTYQYGKDTAASAYSKLPSMRRNSVTAPVVTAPNYNLPEYR